MSDLSASSVRATLDLLAKAGVANYDEQGRATMISVKDLNELRKQLEVEEQPSGFYPLDLVDRP